MTISQIANQLVTAGKGVMAADRPSPAFHDLLRAEGITVDNERLSQLGRAALPGAGTE